eukprot:2834551-Pleurochrysis_carterae.AAC.1
MSARGSDSKDNNSMQHSCHCPKSPMTTVGKKATGNFSFPFMRRMSIRLDLIFLVRLGISDSQFSAHVLILSASTISNYLWCLRNYMKYNRQLDPAYGVAELEDLMKSVQVVTWVESEPCRAVPVWSIKQSLEQVVVTSLVDVQAAFGYGSIDPTHHLTKSGVRVEPTSALSQIWLKAIKQGLRMDRASAASGKD